MICTMFYEVTVGGSYVISIVAHKRTWGKYIKVEFKVRSTIGNNSRLKSEAVFEFIKVAHGAKSC